MDWLDAAIQLASEIPTSVAIIACSGPVAICTLKTVWQNQREQGRNDCRGSLHAIVRDVECIECDDLTDTQCEYFLRRLIEAARLSNCKNLWNSTLSDLERMTLRTIVIRCLPGTDGWRSFRRTQKVLLLLDGPGSAIL